MHRLWVSSRALVRQFGFPATKGAIWCRLHPSATVALSNPKKDAYMLSMKWHAWTHFALRILTACVSLDGLMRSTNLAIQIASLIVFIYSAIFTVMSVSYIKLRSQLGWETKLDIDEVVEYLNNKDRE